ncbi:short-chain dehydrogenase/reductase SDR [Xylariaceae sp. FL1651]|nr:short-chain dehydrogenase/reductase SDR [Xylariaceae sp. FL1651]
MEFRGVALVTGAGSGIDRAVALWLASLNVTILVCADLSLDTAKETATLCQNIKRSTDSGSLKTAAHPVDVRNEASVDDLFGSISQTPIRNMSLADWHSLDEVHNIGCFLLTRAALHIMDGQDAVKAISTNDDRPPVRGAIVMLTSLASEGAFLGVGNYISAKHAVKGMVQTAAIENAVAPSYVSGPTINQFLEASPEVKKAMLGDLLKGRLVEPSEVADAVAFLASLASSYVNGHTLVVDGGASLALSNTPFGSRP